MQLTGSRAICPSACGPNSDWDFIGVVPNLVERAAQLLSDGWESGTSLKFTTNGTPIALNGKFVSLKRGMVNLIITDDAKWRDDFMMATRVATRLGLTIKSQRVDLFQAILYGKG